MKKERHTPEKCGTVTPRTKEVRAAVSDANFRAYAGEPLQLPKGKDAIRTALEEQRIHPLFFTGTGAELAREYLEQVHHIDVFNNPLLWARFTAVAVESMELPGLVPVPVLNPEGHGRS